jgi:hypothetical protein
MPPSALNHKPQHPVRWDSLALRLAVALATTWLVVLAVWAPGIATAAVGSAGPSASHVPCRPARGTTTIAHSAHARIFSDARNGYDYACLFSNGHARMLSPTEHWEYQLVRFSGHYVAFLAVAEEANTYIGVVNLNTGSIRRFHESEEVAPIAPPPGECPSALPNCKVLCPQVDSFVLSSDGGVAWIAVNFPATGLTCGSAIGPVTEVRRYDRRGLEVIATGSGIQATSLRLSGRLLTFTEEGRTVSSTLL